MEYIRKTHGMDRVTIQNQYGIDVKAWCPTCKSYKTCTQGVEEKDFDKNRICSSYGISRGFDNAGKGGGKLRIREGLRSLPGEDGKCRVMSVYKSDLMACVDRLMDKKNP